MYIMTQSGANLYLCREFRVAVRQNLSLNKEEAVIKDENNRVLGRYDVDRANTIMQELKSSIISHNELFEMPKE